MLRIAWPSSGATESTTILLESAWSSLTGIVFVTISRSSGDSAIRCRAGPERTA